ncbi:tRNA (adenosine(37)-N6)-dimethylallyltransferase MiaA [Rhodoferax sp. OV413]|uniref:tRNA (adenosine(37)-N6)-dimethylallyltransferase MiaA n=1 Tax=Rhodoferax sp. OV413 TaxID=1855285 RepID=UPI0025DD9EAB|nr:tRNA (adenosine(37)-N6)-dimethylallyltransferase MiaA [Rhodoferax sp. OV413]
MSQMPPAPAALCLAGPTAAGKTAAAMAIAAEHGAEIISVDSALVYRGMDIGTAKPEPHELAAVRHHLINIRDPLDTYSAAEFAKDACTLMADIRSRGKLPLLVGGTMLYFKALFDGLDDMPAASPAVRAALEAEAAALGWPAMHAQLAVVDPVTAARLAPADSQRIQRALEVYRVSGLPLSHFHAQQSATKNVASGADAAGQYLLFSLEPEDRAWLHERIARRFDLMLQGGFLDEVRTLMARGDLHPDVPSMRCVGYRQAWEALSGISPMAEMRDKGIFATRQLAKRQITWLRSMPQRQVVACDAPGALDTLLRAVRSALATKATP